MKKVALFIVFLQTLIIGFLIHQIYIQNSKKSALEAVINTSPLKKDDLIFPNNFGFKFYSTLPTSTKSEDKRYWNGTFAHYTFNHDGLNDRFDYNVQKSEGVFRIMTLGDSFTFGHYVDTKDNWTEQLEDLLNKQGVCTKFNKFEVINLGMRGFDIPYIAKRYNDIGLKYNPDLIIWFESGSGFLRDNELMQPIVQDCQSKVSSNTSGVLDPKSFYSCWNTAYDQMQKNNSVYSIKNELNKWMLSFLSLRKTTPVLFAGFSNFDQDQKDELQSRSNGQSSVAVMNTVSDITKEDGVFIPDGHPNIKGHTIVAKDIYDYLVENKDKLMQCN